MIFRAVLSNPPEALQRVFDADGRARTERPVLD
jgi:hypothetical protein